MKNMQPQELNSSKAHASSAPAPSAEMQGRVLPGARRAGDLLRLAHLVLSFSIRVKDTRKLRVQKCWNLQQSQRQLRDTQFNGKATTISLASSIVLLEEGGDRHCLESGK